MEIAIAKGNKTRPVISLGICGEHGGDPDSVSSAIASASPT